MTIGWGCREQDHHARRDLDDPKEAAKMEVHHHTHEHGNKGWRTYLWEFTMLFLAVFCGFLAENQREYFMERKRERQYAQTLVRDIRTDLSNLSERMKEYSSAITLIDSILYGYDAFTHDLSGAGGRNFFYIMANHEDFIYTDRTMQQLKYAGGLRLVRSDVSDSIIAYDSEVKFMLNQVNYNTEVYGQLIGMANQLINFRNVFGDGMSGNTRGPGINENTGWIKHDSVSLLQLYNQLYLYATTNSFSVDRMRVLSRKGERLASYLTLTYSLD
jgi:hypothetical protein